jgi:hypothetical protein
MPSSTSRHASFDRWLLAMLYAGIVGTPLLWLTALQTGYVLAYQACDARSTAWVIAPTFAAIIILVVLSLIAFRAHRRADGARLPLPLLGALAIGMSALMTVVMAASAIAPLVLGPCD